MTTDLTVLIDPAEARNARLELLNRIEGVVTLLDNPVVIERSGDSLIVRLSDDLPEEEVRAAIKTLANLVGRPGSGIISAVQAAPENTEGLQRVYSQ